MTDRGNGPSPRTGGVRRRLPALALGLALALSACDGDTLYDPIVQEPGGPDGPPVVGSVVVQVELEARDRMELGDSIVVRVAAFDADVRYGVSRAGYTARIVREGGGGEIVRTAQVTPSPIPGDTVRGTFVIAADWLQPAQLPEAFHLEVYGWALTEDGRCRAAIPEASTATWACVVQGSGASAVTIGTVAPSPVPVLAVRGTTTPFPAGPITVGDLQADTARGRLFLSNRASSRLHVFRPATFEWEGDVLVGAEPWGMHLNRTGDTLLVANSGGTSVSRVSLAGTPAEVVATRVHTRNTPLFEIELVRENLEDPESEVRADSVARTVRFIDFSDRPQHLAMDVEGRVLYSTRPTVAAPTGTVRIVTREPGWQDYHTRILARLPQDATAARASIAVLNADSIHLYWGGLIEVFDHRAGFPSQVIRSGVQPPKAALQTMVDHPDSDVEYLDEARWALEAVSFADTTYVATSGNREWIAFGDGGEPAVGRVVLWHAGTAAISSRLTVADLVNNASERVRALELNSDGTFGMARGTFGTYFFSGWDLRLRGNVPEYVPGGAGAALHPSHPTDPAVPPVGSSATTVAFTATGDRAIRILDTVHYVERGRIPVRDDIVGPLRVTHPFSTDNGGQGRSCQGANCVVAKVFAVTGTGGLVVVDVRASDILPIP